MGGCRRTAFSLAVYNTMKYFLFVVFLVGLQVSAFAADSVITSTEMARVANFELVNFPGLGFEVVSLPLDTYVKVFDLRTNVFKGKQVLYAPQSPIDTNLRLDSAKDGEGNHSLLLLLGGGKYEVSWVEWSHDKVTGQFQSLGKIKTAAEYPPFMKEYERKR